MKKANVFVNALLAGELQEIERGRLYRFVYFEWYIGHSVSLAMPISQLVYEFDRFPPFFEIPPLFYIPLFSVPSSLDWVSPFISLLIILI